MQKRSFAKKVTICYLFCKGSLFQKNQEPPAGHWNQQSFPARPWSLEGGQSSWKKSENPLQKRDWKRDFCKKGNNMLPCASCCLFCKGSLFQKKQEPPGGHWNRQRFPARPWSLEGGQSSWKKVKTICKKGIEKEMFCKKGNNMLPCGSCFLLCKGSIFQKKQEPPAGHWNQQRFPARPWSLEGGQSSWKKVKTLCKKGIEKEMFCKKGNNMLPCTSCYPFCKWSIFQKKQEPPAGHWNQQRFPARP